MGRDLKEETLKLRLLEHFKTREKVIRIKKRKGVDALSRHRFALLIDNINSVGFEYG